LTGRDGVERDYVKWIEKEGGVSGRSYFGLYNSNLSFEDLLFNQRINMFYGAPREYYDNINNMLSVIKVVDSKLDIKDCYFESHSNSDIEEVNMATSWDKIRFNRIAAAIYENSQGEIVNNTVTGAWAGGFLAKNSSELLFKNNQMEGDWFAIAGINSNIEMYNNVIFNIDGRQYMGMPAGNWRGLKQEYPDWIGPIPLWDYPVVGIWLEGESIVMENNTVGQYDVTVQLSSVLSGKIAKNVWVYGENGGIKNQASSGVTISNNLDLRSQSEMHNNFDWNVCASVTSSTSGIRVGNLGKSPLLCRVMPKQNSQVSNGQFGVSFGLYQDNWNDWKILWGVTACSSPIQDQFPGYVCAVGLECNQHFNICAVPGEEAPGGVREGPTVRLPGSGGNYPNSFRQ